jgi:hypothetical protein
MDKDQVAFEPTSLVTWDGGFLDMKTGVFFHPEFSLKD